MKSDLSVQNEILEELKSDTEVAHEHIEVSAKHGIVTLNGYVPTFAEKRIVARKAHRIAGVVGIIDEIKVGGPFDKKHTDEEMENFVSAALLSDVRVPADRIKIKVNDGIVTLTGKVEWTFQKDAAHSVIAPLAGVLGIEDKIEIAQPVRAQA